jgi:hypothetical protein
MDTYLYSYKEKDAWSYGLKKYCSKIWSSKGLEVWKESGRISSNYIFDFVLAIGVLVLGCNFSKVQPKVHLKHKLHKKVKVETWNMKLESVPFFGKWQKKWLLKDWICHWGRFDTISRSGKSPNRPSSDVNVMSMVYFGWYYLWCIIYLFIYLVYFGWLPMCKWKVKVQSPEVQCMAMTNVAQVPKPENNTNLT